MENKNVIDDVLHEIKREQSASSGIPKLKSIIMISEIFKFLSPRDIKEIGRVNVQFHNCVIRYKLVWSNKLASLSAKYNFKILPREIDLDEEEAISKGRSFQRNDRTGEYIKITKAGIEHIALFNKEIFSWSNSPEYWTKLSYNNSLYGGPTYTLIRVCYLDPKIEITNVEEGNYQLYIRQSFKPQFNVKCMTIKIFLDGKEVYSNFFPSKNIIDDCVSFNEEIIKKETTNQSESENTNGNLVSNPVHFIGKRRGFFPVRTMLYSQSRKDIKYLNDSYITNIEKDMFSNKEKSSHEIRVEIKNNDGNWKYGWALDGIILTPLFSTH